MPVPVHIAVLIVAVTALTAVSVIALLSRAIWKTETPVSRRWIAVGAVAAAVAGWYAARFWLGLNMTRGGGLLVVLSFAVTFGLAGFALLVPLTRRTVWSLPQRWLIAVQTGRVGGAVFLALLDMRLLPPEFAVPAGYGDVLVGLAVAMVTGILFIAPYARQLAMAGQSLDFLNYVLLIPGFGVPVLMLVHILSLAKVLSRKVESGNGVYR